MLSQDQLDNIAKIYFDIDTLQTQFSDDKDFHTLACWQLREALHQAYVIGLNEAKIN